MLFSTRNHTLDFSKTLVMGILNITPDSFSDGGEYALPSLALKRALEMVRNGADLIDIGGESSRPGSEEISEDEELKRVIPVIKGLRSRVSVPISIDTYKPSVARASIRGGAEIVNDITALSTDGMAEVVKESDAGVILMHMQGRPCNMQNNPQYSEVIDDIKTYLHKRVNFAIKSGIKKEKIMIDPGIGFGKTVSQNMMIINKLGDFKSLGVPILVGTSRKGFIGKVLDLPVDERMEGTAATVCISIMNGANMVRVHDVKEIKRAVVMTDSIIKGV